MSDAALGDPWRVSDGVISIRPPRSGDAARLVAGRDEESRRWLGPGADEPTPTACIERDGEVIGWVDHETGHPWLAEGEVNVGYGVFLGHRRRGLATRAVMLLLHRAAIEGQIRSASVLIEREHLASLGVAARARFSSRREMGDNLYLVRPIPPLVYGDGVVILRPQAPSDLEALLAAIDEEQIRWLWQPGERERWEEMGPAGQREHQARWLRRNCDAFGAGPKWAFTVDTPTSACVAYVDADLANPNAAAGEANLAYSCHPEHRGRGYASRALRLLLRFVAEHTGARRAHIVVDRGNHASLRVARAVATAEPEPFVDASGRPHLRFVLDVDRFAG